MFNLFALEFRFRRSPLFALALAAGLGGLAPAEAAERWVPLGPSGGLVRDLFQAPSDRQRLYAVTEEFEPRSRALYVGTDRRGVFRSTDSGRTFRRVAAGLPQMPGGLNPFVSALTLDAAGDLYASLWSAGVYRLRRGQGWTAVNAGLPLEKFYGPLAADPEIPGLIYAPTYGASVLRLEDR